METIAEKILEKHQPSMLEEPRSLDISALITALDIQLIEQKLSQDNSIFGEIVFKDMLIRCGMRKIVHVRLKLLRVQ